MPSEISVCLSTTSGQTSGSSGTDGWCRRSRSDHGNVCKSPSSSGLIKPFLRQLLPNDQGSCHQVIRQSQVRCSGDSPSSGQSFVSLRTEITPIPSSWCSATNVSAVDRQAVPNAGKERPQRHKTTCRCEWNFFDLQPGSHAVS